MSLQESPFKFLDSYQQADHEVFFGREKETKDLYNALSGVKVQTGMRSLFAEGLISMHPFFHLSIVN